MGICPQIAGQVFEQAGIQPFTSMHQEINHLSKRIWQIQPVPFDPKLIDNFVGNYLEDQTERFGGTVEAARFLRENRLDPGDWRNVTRNEVYAAQWEQAVLGRGPGATGRPRAARRRPSGPGRAPAR